MSSGRGGIDRLTLASRSSTTRGAGVGGGDAGIGDSVALIGANAEQQFGELAERLGTLSAGVGSTIVDSFANGITAAVQTGSISDGFKELGRTLIGGLGAQVRDFGIQSLKIGTLMEGLFKSLAGFIPGGTIGASVALIALGSAMVGLAGRGARSSFGRTNSGIDRGATSSSTIIERGTIGLPSSIYGGGATSAGPTGQVASAMQPVYVNATIIGPNDPSAQRQIAELVRKSAARGAA